MNLSQRCTITYNLISSCHQQKEIKLCACCRQHVPNTNRYKEEHTTLATIKGPHCSSISSSGPCIVALHATTNGKNHCFTCHWILPTNICTVKQLEELACTTRKQDHSDLKSWAWFEIIGLKKSQLAKGRLTIYKHTPMCLSTKACSVCILVLYCKPKP